MVEVFSLGVEFPKSFYHAVLYNCPKKYDNIIVCSVDVISIHFELTSYISEDKQCT